MNLYNKYTHGVCFARISIVQLNSKSVIRIFYTELKLWLKFSLSLVTRVTHKKIT